MTLVAVVAILLGAIVTVYGLLYLLVSIMARIDERADARDQAEAAARVKPKPLRKSHDQTCYVCHCDLTDRSKVGHSITDLVRVMYVCKNCMALAERMSL
jgi:hypothetical protein